MNNIPVEKNKEYIVDIIDNGFEGEGIAKIDNFTIFIPNSIKGEKCRILIVKVLSSRAYGKIVEIIQESKNRIDVDCSTYKRCGGCDLRHMTYESTLEIKKNTVQSLINKGVKSDVIVQNTIGMEKPYNYRNKAQYPVGLDKNGNPAIGVFAKMSHTIIPIEKCFIQTEISQKIANTIMDFVKKNNIEVYNEEKQTGLLRHIIIKVGMQTHEVMCILVLNKEQFKQEKQLVDLLISKYSDIKAIVKNINTKNTNVILGNKNIILYGDGYIYDDLLGFKFKISPMSFYQVNPIQTEKLYSTAIEKAKLNGDETVFDLYCGIGTIGICASKNIKKLYGIETVPQAIEDARRNAKENGIKNAEFFVGDVEKELPEFIEKNNISADMIFIDPPRKGCDKVALDTIMKICPKKIVYVSCNPATLARDLKILSEKYDIGDVTPVDMFPFTSHVECVAVLHIKKL